MKENHREILVVSNAKGKRFSLIETDNNYIVACGYSALERWGRQWEHGIYYVFLNDKEKLAALNKATEKLFEKVSENYISSRKYINDTIRTMYTGEYYATGDYILVADTVNGNKEIYRWH